jgi:hypothetical protein
MATVLNSTREHFNSCAKRELNSNRENDDEASSSSSSLLLTDKKIKAWISQECHQDVEDFLCSYERELSKRSRGRETTSNRRHAQEQVEFYLDKSLVHYCHDRYCALWVLIIPISALLEFPHPATFLAKLIVAPSICLRSLLPSHLFRNHKVRPNVGCPSKSNGPIVLSTSLSYILTLCV